MAEALDAPMFKRFNGFKRRVAYARLRLCYRDSHLLTGMMLLRVRSPLRSVCSRVRSVSYHGPGPHASANASAIASAPLWTGAATRSGLCLRFQSSPCQWPALCAIASSIIG
jgi:hypothetical protein